MTSHSSRMLPEGRMCPICYQWKHEDQMEGQTWYGETICGACYQTFEQCARCGYTVEPHQIAERDNTGEPICPECRQKYDDSVRCDWCEKLVTNLENAKGTHSLGVKLLQCGPCRTRQYVNRNGGIRRHPTAIASDALDQECAQRIARER